MALFAQVDIGYQEPAKEILDLADASLPPAIRINTKGDHIILLKRNRYKSLEELAVKEMKLAGLRLDPKTNSASRGIYYNGMSIMAAADKKIREVEGLPQGARLANLSWSPDETKLAFTNSSAKGLELWLLDLYTAKAQRLTAPNLNANLGSPFRWFQESQLLLVCFVAEDRKPLADKDQLLPTGPRISINDGQKAQNLTYQDLLKDKTDEFNFEELARSTLYTVDLKGTKKIWKETAMYSGFSFSPDGEYVRVQTVQKPFSYLVPCGRFPSNITVYTKAGKLVKNIVDIPLVEDLPKGFMSVRKGKRSILWRSDKPATLYWMEALDEGDPAKEVEFRDRVMNWPAPFSEEPVELLKTQNRCHGLEWCNDDLAVAYDYWWNSRNTKTYLFNPSDNSVKPQIIHDRNYQDRYNDPGDFVSQKNQYNRYVLELDGQSLYLTGEGYSPEGIRPFVDRFDLQTKETTRLWRAENKTVLERLVYPFDIKKGKILTRIESASQYPNYFVRNIKTGEEPKPITNFENPFKGLQEVSKEIIKYKREDGVELSATMYLPPNYDKEKKEKLPMVVWAYPYEFKDKSSAGQVTTSQNEFTYPWYGSPIFWVLRGFVVLDDASFPIIGEGEEQPNDSFMTQLVSNAKAAIDAVDSFGYIDRQRVAVGGHSYGAFMTANLLSHSDLFAAGIARSGAYNRTLTPFGFQSEERNYWEAPEVYNNMSPFMHAEKMKYPLLLIHGEEDNNSGTYPLQSERYFNALKGLGAQVRMVMLPKESHGYRARASVLHVLWEQDEWLMNYVKNKPKKEAATEVEAKFKNQ